MMKLIICAALTLLPFITPAQPVEQIRALFARGQHDEQIAKSLYESLEKQENKSPVLLGYQGAAAALLAKHAINPMSKVKHLRTSQTILDQAIAKDPDNYEIRMLRFAIEVKTPGMFLEVSHKAEDAKIMVAYLLSNKGEVNDFNSKIASKVIKYDGCDDATAAKLQQKYSLDLSNLDG